MTARILSPRILSPRILQTWMIAVLTLMLVGCDTVLLAPSGDVAQQQSDLMVKSVWLMLLIVVPVIVLTFWFAWRYRESNTEATYRPDWDHSPQIELYVWAAPLLIIIALGALTWVSTHTLDPFRPLSRISPEQPVPEEAEPLVIQAVALEWKWLFIYPEQGIAVVNQLAAPVDKPIQFKITSPQLMNALFIPALAGMVYGMPAMQTELQAVINEPGDYYGISGNYSGEGYSDMRFRFHGLSQNEFDQWIANARSSGSALTSASYKKLAEPSIDDPVRRFATVEPDLYHRILNLCVDPQKICVDKMMHATQDQHSADQH